MGAEKLHDDRGRDLDKDVIKEKDGVDPVKKFASWIPSKKLNSMRNILSSIIKYRPTLSGPGRQRSRAGTEWA
jgi:hypothetical protein